MDLAAYVASEFALGDLEFVESVDLTARVRSGTNRIHFSKVICYCNKDIQ